MARIAARAEQRAAERRAAAAAGSGGSANGAPEYSMGKMAPSSSAGIAVTAPVRPVYLSKAEREAQALARLAEKREAQKAQRDGPGSSSAADAPNAGGGDRKRGRSPSPERGSGGGRDGYAVANDRWPYDDRGAGRDDRDRFADGGRGGGGRFDDRGRDDRHRDDRGRGGGGYNDRGYDRGQDGRYNDDRSDGRGYDGDRSRDRDYRDNRDGNYRDRDYGGDRGREGSRDRDFDRRDGPASSSSSAPSSSSSSSSGAPAPATTTAPSAVPSNNNGGKEAALAPVYTYEDPSILAARQREFEAAKKAYLGLKEEPLRKKATRPAEKMARVFKMDWDATEDTSVELDDLYANRLSSGLARGRPSAPPVPVPVQAPPAAAAAGAGGYGRPPPVSSMAQPAAAAGGRRDYRDDVRDGRDSYRDDRDGRDRDSDHRDRMDVEDDYRGSQSYRGGPPPAGPGAGRGGPAPSPSSSAAASAQALLASAVGGGGASSGGAGSSMPLPGAHWSEKQLHEMTDRDWRIMREDFDIHIRGGKPLNPLRSWNECPMPESLRRAIDDAGYKQPTPIQRQAIVMGLNGRDLIGIAETGSGKTAAFLIPLLSYVLSQPPEVRRRVADAGPLALVMAPTRELAQQIGEEAAKLCRYTDIKTASVVGGLAIQEQGVVLRKGVDVVIGTPGRLIDMLDNRYLVLHQCLYVVLDEADR